MPSTPAQSDPITFTADELRHLSFALRDRSVRLSHQIGNVSQLEGIMIVPQLDEVEALMERIDNLADTGELARQSETARTSEKPSGVRYFLLTPEEVEASAGAPWPAPILAHEAYRA